LRPSTALDALYLVQEVRSDALTRDLDAFARLLEMVARQNAQTTNATGIACDTGVHWRTVESHFQILVDTLVGHWLPAWRLRSSNRQLQRSKFWFFDCGVARTLTGRLPYPSTNEELGPQMETLVIKELRTYLAYSKLGCVPHSGNPAMVPRRTFCESFEVAKSSPDNIGSQSGDVNCCANQVLLLAIV